MKTKLFKIIKLMIGFVFCAVGIVLTINANLGLSPWDVLHEGISKTTGITMGNANILVSAIVLVLNVFLGERLGLGTLLNMVIIGRLIDIIMLNDLIHMSNDFVSGILMLIIGMIILSIGCYLYIGVGLGSGARDGMMVALQKRSGRPIRVVRGSLEIGAVVIGFLLGGTIGIGTIITSIGLGYCMQFIFKIFNFNVVSVNHRYIKEEIKSLNSFFYK
ncbi:membrane protein [Paraclostridium bifermentans]